jgi:rod shape-determining protein MreD
VRHRRRVWIVVATLVVLHFFLHVGLGLGPVAPDLLTLALLIGARALGPGAAAGMGLGFGLLEDALSVLSFGANAVAMTALGAFGSLTRDLFVGDSLVFLVSYFVLGKWLRDLMHWLMVSEPLRRPFLDQVLLQGFVGGAYAAVVGIFVMAVSGLWRETPR